VATQTVHFFSFFFEKVCNDGLLFVVGLDLLLEVFALRFDLNLLSEFLTHLLREHLNLVLGILNSSSVNLNIQGYLMFLSIKPIDLMLLYLYLSRYVTLLQIQLMYHPCLLLYLINNLLLLLDYGLSSFLLLLNVLLHGLSLALKLL
jgi:hypothetical protein